MEALCEATRINITPPAMEAALRSHADQHHATCDGSRSAKPRGSTSRHLRWKPLCEATRVNITPPAMEAALRSHAGQHHATCDGSRSAKPRGSTSRHLRWKPL